MTYWFEVEAKARVKDVEALRKKLRQIAFLEKKEFRADDYFALHKEGYPRKSFRIRFNGKEYVGNFKQKVKSLSDEGVVVKKEYEFNLGSTNVDNFVAFLSEFGFKEWVKKRKQTESYRYKKNKRLVIEINKVQHLDYFVEIEFLAQKDEIAMAKKLVRQVLQELGLEKSIDNVGYTKRLYERGIKDKKYFIKS